MNKTIGQRVYDIDKEVRDDLANGYIVSERDYMSTLMAYIRKEFKTNKYSQNSFCYSQVLPGGYEQEFGCDVMIVVRHSKEKKCNICLIEAKYPRICKNKSYSWDNIIKSKNSQFSGKSRFSSELERQRTSNQRKQSYFYIYEMFIIEAKKGRQPTIITQIDNYGSTLVSHDDFYDYYKNRKNPNQKTWKTNPDLIDVFSIYQTYNIQQILDELSDFNQGNSFNIDTSSGKITFELNSDYYSRQVVEIPIPPSNLQEDNSDLQKKFQKEFIKFIKSTGLKHFLYIHLKAEEDND